MQFLCRFASAAKPLQIRLWNDLAFTLEGSKYNSYQCIVFGLLLFEIICMLLEKFITSLLIISFWSAVRQNTVLHHRGFINHSVCNHLPTFICYDGSSFITWSCLRNLRHPNSCLHSCSSKRLHSLFDLSKRNWPTGFREGLFTVRFVES